MADRALDTVIFDVGNVLLDFCRLTYFKKLGYPDEMADRLREATFDGPDWGEIDRGVLTVPELLDRFVAAAPQLEADIRRSFQDFTGVVERRDTAIPWIDSVKARGFKVYILSNFSWPVTRDCPEALDFRTHADGCYWSWEHKIIKPDRAIYLDMLSEFRIDPARAVFVDDSQRNLDAAAALGIKTVHYRTQKQAERDLDALLHGGRDA